MSLKIYITVLKRKTSLDVILKHKTPSSFSVLITARAEINSTRALPVIARAWLCHCSAYGERISTEFFTVKNLNCMKIGQHSMPSPNDGPNSTTPILFWLVTPCRQKFPD